MDETLRIVKRINERLASYERKGLTDSAYYRNILERIELLGLPTTRGRNGELRISRATEDLRELATDLRADLDRVDRLPALREELRKLPRELRRASREEKYEHIRAYGYLRTWCEEHLVELYNEARSGLSEANELQELFDNGARNRDYSEIFRLIEAYERARARSRASMRGNSFIPDGV